MRYFKDRSEAGKLLAQQMKSYANKNCAVLALSEGSVLVGAEIAKTIHSSLYLLPVNSVLLPENLASFNTMSTTSMFNAAHNSEHVNAEDITAESKMMLSKLDLANIFDDNSVLSKEGTLSKELLKRHIVIIVSDGIANGLSVSIANDFLRPIATKHLVLATPVCNAEIMEELEDVTRDLFCLDRIQSEYPISHYYADDKIPSRDEALNLMNRISLEW